MRRLGRDMIGESGVGGRAGEAFFQVLRCFQARASTAFQTVGWGMSHDPANTWAVVTTPFSIDWCSTSRRWRLHSESSSKPYAVVCERHRAPPRPPVRRSSGLPAQPRTARFPRAAKRLGSTWRLSASLSGRTRVSAGPGHDQQQPRVRRLPFSTCGL